MTRSRRRQRSRVTRLPSFQKHLHRACASVSNVGLIAIACSVLKRLTFGFISPLLHVGFSRTLAKEGTVVTLNFDSGSENA